MQEQLISFLSMKFPRVHFSVIRDAGVTVISHDPYCNDATQTKIKNAVDKLFEKTYDYKKLKPYRIEKMPF